MNSSADSGSGLIVAAIFLSCWDCALQIRFFLEKKKTTELLFLTTSLSRMTSLSDQ